MLSETPRVHPQVQDPGCADIAQQRRCVQLCPRIYSKRHFFLLPLPPYPAGGAVGLLAPPLPFGPGASGAAG